jgi:endonuclease YncB( thermonuclease family)
MNHKNLIILIFIALIGLAPSQKPFYSIKFVYDGDTILTNTDQKVRYLGIDAPEIGYGEKKSEFMAVAARDENIRLVKKRKVILEFDRERTDQYGRLLAYLYLENGEMVNALLLRKGLAHVAMKLPNLRYLQPLLHFQRLAIEERIGIWKAPEGRAEVFYLGNNKSYRFHRPNCTFGRKTGSNHRLQFSSRKEAFWEGFRPCNKCQP